MTRMDEQMSGADKRREMRRSLELDASNINKISMNDIMLAGIVVIAMVLSLTDFTLSPGDFRNFTALTLFLYVVTTIVYRNRYNRGKLRGRNDPEYQKALEDYRKAKEKIVERGIASSVPAFCQYYKAHELKEYRKGILADVDMDYDEYMKSYRQLSFWETWKLPLPYHSRIAIIKCNYARPIKLTPGLIMNESGEADREKLIAQSGMERERIDKLKQFIWRGVVVFLGCMIAVTIIFDFSFIAIVRWLVRMLPIVSAIIMGDDSGFCNIAVTETNFKKDQVSIINLLLEYNEKVKDEPAPEEPAPEEHITEEPTAEEVETTTE